MYLTVDLRLLLGGKLSCLEEDLVSLGRLRLITKEGKICLDLLMIWLKRQLS